MPLSHTTIKLEPNRFLPFVSQGSRGAGAVVLWGACLAVCVAVVSLPASAQDALRSSMAGDAAAYARRIQQQNAAYTYKAGDFRLLASASLGLDWTDNVRLSNDGAGDDFILRPRVGLSASYPLTQRNLLQMNVTFGYDEYFNHDNFSGWYLQSGSELSFDVYIKDFWINFHDRFSYQQDPARDSAIANTGDYGVFQNTAGVRGIWDLQDVELSLGYDHLNYLTTSDYYDYTDHASEMVTSGVGLRVHPKATVGVEGSVSFTAYDKAILNDNTGCSAGVYGEWRPGPYFTLMPRFGYTIYDFRQTSRVVPAKDVDSWYADLTVRHDATEYMSYSLSVGHEIRLGLQADAIEDTYVRPAVTWKVFKRVSVQTGLFYEHGKQSGGRMAGFNEDNFDWYGGNISLSYTILKNLSASLNYRVTFRSSDAASRDYTQNMIGLQISYSPR